MPFPVAHGLLAASVAAALIPSSATHRRKTLIISAFLGIFPDIDYTLNLLRVSGGGWHHGFTHSFVFAFLLGLITAMLSGARNARSVVVFSAAAASHTILDFVMTESQGVASWWPFTNQRYKLMMPNPIDYDWSSASLWADVIRISFVELLIFAPILLVVLFLRRQLARPGAKSDT